MVREILYVLRFASEAQMYAKVETENICLNLVKKMFNS